MDRLNHEEVGGKRGELTAPDLANGKHQVGPIVSTRS